MLVASNGVLACSCSGLGVTIRGIPVSVSAGLSGEAASEPLGSGVAEPLSGPVPSRFWFAWISNSCRACIKPSRFLPLMSIPHPAHSAVRSFLFIFLYADNPDMLQAEKIEQKAEVGKGGRKELLLYVSL